MTPARHLARAVLVVSIAGGAARADTVESTYGGDLRETSVRLDAQLGGRLARLRFTRRLENRGTVVDEAALSMSLPERAAVVGLRRKVANRWLTGALLDAEAASGRYDRLTTTGAPGAPLGPSLLTWEPFGVGVTLTTFPIRPGQPVDHELDVVAHGCYAHGLAVVHVALPDDADDPQPSPQIHLAARGRRHWVVETGTKVPRELADRWEDVLEHCPNDGSARSAALVVERDPGPTRPLATATASFALASGRRLVHLEIDVARELQPLPRRARLVFVVDASISQGAEGIARQLDLVVGALAHVRDADFEIVVVRRGASRLFGRFVPAEQAARALARLPRTAFELENGSNLEAGLALAAALLPAGERPGRVIAFSDDLVRDALTPPIVAAALTRMPSGAVLHLVTTGAAVGLYAWQRDDDHPFADAVAATGGMLVYLSGRSGVQGASARDVTLGLLKPLRIDQVGVTGPLAEQFADQYGDELAEGDGVRMTVWTRDPPEAIRLSGRIWGRAVDIAVPVDADLEAALPARVFGLDAPSGELWRELDETEQREAARRGHAVSPVTSLLVDPGGPATSFGDVFASSGCGCMALGTRGGGGGSFVGRSASTPTIRLGELIDRPAILAGMLDAGARACEALHGGAVSRAHIETTREEVVDVAIDVAPGAPAALADCAAEAAWSLRLDATRFSQPHVTHTVRL